MVRKTVTLVFCDVADSTPLGEQLDPEALRDVWSLYHETARAVLERHGGTIEKFIGDAVMAAFGIPAVHEDDALRAVRAAVELRDELRALNDQLERAYGIRIGVRTGINTGEVVVGDPSQGQAFATGDAVNVAQRLEATAAGGEILLGDATMRLVRHAVSAEPLPLLELKGKSQPVAAWRLLTVQQDARAVERRLDAPLVGRLAELDVLHAELEQALAERTCRVVTILGDPGIGKSRLVAELVASLDGAALTLEGRCLPYGQGITYWPLVEIVRQLSGDAAPGEALPLLLAGDADADLVTARVLEAIGQAPPQSRSDELYWAVRRLFETLARERPAVIVLDDVQWGESAFLDLVEYLAGWSRDAPLLVVCLARPDLLELRPGWGVGGVSGALVHLAPLGQAETRKLIDGILGSHLESIPEAAIVRATEGNPLFVEEMVRMLVEDGVLRERDGTWEAPRSLPSLRVPETIQAVLAARLDLLEPDERTVLQRASVVGEVFWWSALAELADGEEAAATGAVLQTLVRKRLIHPERSTLPGEDAFGFGHILVRDAAYDSLAKRQRAELHERFADWVCARAATSVEADELLGYHFEQAHRYRLEVGVADERARRLGESAGGRLEAAGRRALLRGDAPAAAHLLDRAVALPAAEAVQLERRLLLGRALKDSGDLGRASAALDVVVEEANAAGELRIELFAQIEHSFLHIYTGRGDVDEFMCLGERAAQEFAALGDEGGLSQAWNLIAHAHFVQCRVGEMETALTQALRHAEAAGDRPQAAYLLRALGRAALVGPTPVEDALQRCAELRELGAGDRALEAVLMAIHAYLSAMLGRFEEAREACAQSHAALQEIGMPVLLGGGRGYSGAVELLAGDPVAAEQELRAGVEMLESIDEKGNLSTVAAYLAEALTLQDRNEEALAYTELSERTASDFDVMSHVAWRAARARVRARAGDFAAAEDLAREAVALAAPTDYVDLHGDALARLADVLRASGAREEAARAAAAAAAMYAAKGNVVAVARVEEAAATLS
jgi:class 3 adenylate cyclase/tetratricopeptide (TPR) repeat protein